MGIGTFISNLFRIGLPAAFYTVVVLSGDDCSCQKEFTEKVKPFVADQLTQKDPTLAVDTDNGNYLLCWQSTDQAGSSLRSVLLGPSGERRSQPVIFESGPAPNTFSIAPIRSVYSSSSHKFLVTWQVTIHTKEGKPVRDELRGQFFSTDGKRLGPTFVITNRDPYHLRNNALIHSPAGNEYLLVYSLAKQGMMKNSIFLQRLNADGKRISEPITANPDKVRQFREIAHDPRTNRFLLTWNAANQDSTETYFQVFGANLQSVGPERRIAPGNQESHRVLYNHRKGNFAIFWVENGTIKARAVSPDNQYAGDIADLKIQGYLSDVAQDSLSGDFIVTYESPTSNNALLLADVDQDLSMMQKDFNATCQDPTRIRPGATIIHNPVRKEFMFTWVYSSVTPKTSEDIYGQRIRITTLGICPPLL